MRLRVENLNFAYGNKVVLSNISFSLKSGDFLRVIGKNGSGKSTLVRCLLNINKISPSTIFYDDIDVVKIKKFTNIGYIPQKIVFHTGFPLTVRELLHISYPKKQDYHYTSIISSLDLFTILDNNVNKLSGGQLRKTMIARTLLNKPKLLILDEPTTGVDTDNISTLSATLEQLKKEGITIILITHDNSFCRKLADYHLHLHVDANENTFEVYND